MNPAKVRRDKVKTFTDLPNVGPATAEDLQVLGFKKPEDLVGQDPYKMFEELCRVTGVRHDPCVIDVFLSITRFLEGDEPQAWWFYTAERKALGTLRVP
jgi:hypothetical protein